MVAISVRAPTGDLVEMDDESGFIRDPFLQMEKCGALRAFYDTNGYVVAAGLIPPELCDRVLGAFRAQVKPYDGYIYRQTTQNPERHVLSPAGFVLNPILNVQSLPEREFGTFRNAALNVLTHQNLRLIVAELLDEQPKIVQTMYFEGNPVTWAHQDTYYLDAETVGTMVGAWVALEDIAVGAGRFYVYPGSHKLDMFKNSGEFDVAFNHQRYKQLVLDVIRQNHLRFVAPALKKGDVLFWSSKTIHGSLETSEPHRSRNSMTCHLISRRSRFLQFQSRIKDVSLMEVNGMQVNHPKDLDRLGNRLMLGFEVMFPKSFQMMKRIAIKLVTR
jgi:phytanoyl-CoA hydroxylase